ncbi:MAG: alpha/beta fold hydrolase [Bacteroidota bacterium]
MKKIFLPVFLVIIVGITLFGLNPAKKYEITPKDVDLSFEEVTIPTDDGAKLKGWYYPSTSDKTSYKIVIISDDVEGNMSDQIEMASKFLTLGYHVLSYDYRGYGQSSDFEVKKKFYIHTQFEKDLQGALKFVREKYPKIVNINFYGKGIGAGLSICVAANDPKIKHIIADSPYTYFEEMSKLLSSAGQDVVFPMAYDKIIMEPKYNLESNMDMDKINARILYICGSKDPVYNAKLIKSLQKIRPERSSVYIVKNATIANTFTIDKEAYYAQLKGFLE